MVEQALVHDKNAPTATGERCLRLNCRLCRVMFTGDKEMAQAQVYQIRTAAAAAAAAAAAVVAAMAMVVAEVDEKEEEEKIIELRVHSPPMCVLVKEST